MKKDIKPAGYWNDYDRCKEVALTCSTVTEFEKKYPGAYAKARKNKWYKDWFKKDPNVKRTLEDCESVARRFTSLKDFREQEPRVYSYSYKYGLLPKFTWLVRREQDYEDENGVKIAKGKFFSKYENNMEESKKYKTRTEFYKKNPSAYDIARVNRWLDDYVWLNDERFDYNTDLVDSVYVYEFVNFNAAYIGRTLMRLQKNKGFAAFVS